MGRQRQCKLTFTHSLAISTCEVSAPQNSLTQTNSKKIHYTVFAADITDKESIQSFINGNGLGKLYATEDNSTLCPQNEICLIAFAKIYCRFATELFSILRICGHIFFYYIYIIYIYIKHPPSLRQTQTRPPDCQTKKRGSSLHRKCFHCSRVQRWRALHHSI